MKFAKDQIVRIRSGGPPMVVEDVKGSELLCAWLSDRQLKRDWFDQKLIELDDPYESALRVQKHSKRMRKKLRIIQT